MEKVMALVVIVLALIVSAAHADDAVFNPETLTLQVPVVEFNGRTYSAVFELIEFNLPFAQEIVPDEDVPGIGDPCLPPPFGKCRNWLKCGTNLKCFDPSQATDPVHGDPVPVVKCAFPVGHPDYCFSCGPCLEGQGGCNRTYQCVEGLKCDLTTNKCVRPK